MRLLPCQRHLFDIPRDVAYFNCAYMAPLLRAAQTAGENGIARKAQPWRLTGADFFAETEATRALFARLIGAEADDIAFIPAASYGMAVATRNLPLRPGQTVVIAAEDFPSGVFAWQKAARDAKAEIITVPRPADGDWTRAMVAAIDARTAVVLASETHWVCGGRMDLAAISTRAKTVGAALVLDLTQSCGAVPFDVTAIDPDFIATAAYKWVMGPYSFGFLYVAPRHQQGEPLEQGWICRQGSEDFRRIVEYQEDFQPGARRFDVGQRSNFALMPVARAALEQLLAWGVRNTAETLAELTARIEEGAQALGAETQPRHLRSPHFLSLRLPAGLSDSAAADLAARNVHVSLRGDRMRITPHLYNDEEDIRRLFAALKETSTLSAR